MLRTATFMPITVYNNEKKLTSKLSSIATSCKLYEDLFSTRYNGSCSTSVLIISVKWCRYFNDSFMISRSFPHHGTSATLIKSMMAVNLTSTDLIL